MRFLLFAIFFASGFSGLVYESVWSHYLKALLGHAAYAQTVVLVIFMGGMALGAWLASRFTTRIRRPLTAYAITEGTIGLLGLVFHSLFIAAESFLFDSFLPGLGSPALAVSFKWALAGFLILPQSILLGMTFPLMSVGLIRTARERSGNALSMLYFTNSLGAAVGVLFSAFLFIPAFGLPGAIFTAGLLNLVLALVAWLADKSREPAPAMLENRVPDEVRGMRLFAIAAFVTGLASFCYEIGWIRMLSMVLGSTMQAFELMLAAFIAGLAFGGLAVRKRLDQAHDLYRLAAFVQLAMGGLAVLTLPAYNGSFELMANLLLALDQTEAGYTLFNTASLLISMIIMVPVTFMAGMTLPLFTQAALDAGSGEAGVGRIYAANTVGAIIGVVLSVHLLLPVIGTRGVILFGAFCDMTLGIYLLTRARRRTGLRVLVTGAAMLFVAALVAFRIDPLTTASGVYRHGVASLPAETEVLFHEDGKTATVDVIRLADGDLSIRTNGKPDAQVAPLDKAAGPDEVTMVLLGAMPQFVRPDARQAANIGMGSGISTHVLLASDALEAVDTIEIERAMVAGARKFAGYNDRVFSDPRSEIFIDDAKSFFSTHGKRYDVIVSEPSNPWISGVSSLFSREFYRRVRQHLSDSGILVQWLQLYEFELRDFVSVMKALSAEFPHYDIYHADNANLVIVAGARDIPGPDPRAFSNSALDRELARVDIRNTADIASRWFGDEQLLGPWLASYAVPANSDYYPFLAYSAPRSRYLGINALEPAQAHVAPVPVLPMVSPLSWMPSDVTPSNATLLAGRVSSGRTLVDALVDGGAIDSLGERQQYAVTIARQAASRCGDGMAPDVLASAYHFIALGMNTAVDAASGLAAWEAAAPGDCRGKWPGNISPWLRLYRAVAAREPEMILRQGMAIRDGGVLMAPWQRQYLALATLGGAVASGDPGAANLAREWLQTDPDMIREDLLLRMLATRALDADRSPD